jgi:hypothetical protein
LVETKPYVDLNDGLRMFKSYINDDELVWHRDREDREVAVVETGGGWQFQFDDKMPFELYSGTLLEIPKMTYHRLIKGEGDLVLKIWKE